MLTTEAPRSSQKSPVRLRKLRFCSKNAEYRFGLCGILVLWAGAPKNAVLGGWHHMYLARGTWLCGFLAQEYRFHFCGVCGNVKSGFLAWKRGLARDGLDFAAGRPGTAGEHEPERTTAGSCKGIPASNQGTAAWPDRRGTAELPV